jgi:hypothetical protein
MSWARISRSTRLWFTLRPRRASSVVIAGLAVGPVELVVDQADRRDQRGLGLLGVAGPGGLACAPVTERLTGDLRDVAGRGDREALGLPGSDPAVAGHCPDSFTQKAVARLSRSRSIRSRAFSLRSSASSARSDVVRPGSAGSGWVI